MFGQDRNELRRMFFATWRKHRAHAPMEPLEQTIAHIIAQHPEYHALLEDEDAYLTRDYLPEMGQTNPFLHMAMHIAIQEQLGTDRPAGVREAYQALLTRFGDPHAVEHDMMECLAEALWQAQRQGLPPDDTAYLACLRLRGAGK